MALYALIDDGEQIVRMVDDSKLDLNAGVATGYRWIPVNDSTVNNSITGYTTANTVVTVLADEVTRVTTITDVAQSEIDLILQGRANRLVEQDVGRVFKLVFETLFYLANDVRDRHGQGALTPAQFRTALESLDAIDATAFRDWLQSTFQ